MLETVHHLALEVRDIAESVAWYCQQFRCEVVYQDASWALLKFANIHLALVLPEQHPAHLAFEKPEAEAYGKLVTHRDGRASVYISDPSGNAIEILKI